MKTSIKSPELLLPAGGMAQLRAGLLYGGDAFYLSVGDLSLRAMAKGFSWDELNEALLLTHQKAKRLYFCLNIFAYEKQLPMIRETLARLQAYDIDGLIVADPGVLSLARHALPNVEIHLSTQANTSNSETAKFWLDQGVTRLNLARELDYKSIRAIREAVPHAELEVFVHGAMCVAISGRCLMSAYLTNRSANLGACAHTCRYQYRPINLPLEESTRQGQAIFELEESNEFSEILAADDLCLVRYLNWLQLVGVNAVKVEGRTKSAGYIAQVADVYRTALDDLKRGERHLNRYYEALSAVGSRRLTTGMFLPKRRTVLEADRTESPPIFAQLLDKIADDAWRIEIKEQWRAGSEICLMLPGLERPLFTNHEYAIETVEGKQLEVAHPGMKVVLRLDDKRLCTGMFLLGFASRFVARARRML